MVIRDQLIVSILFIDNSREFLFLFDLGISFISYSLKGAKRWLIFNDQFVALIKVNCLIKKILITLFSI